MKQMKEQKPEILAPAGTYEAMEAAVKAGCDAVYAGGSLFSARAYAGNFDEEAYLKALDFCHLHGVKVYMTLNTLLKETEIFGDAGQNGASNGADSRANRIVSYLMPYYKAGLDAVLVQDMGVLKILRDNFPDLPVHASTQMSISSSYGAQLAKDLGLERIVPARELSLEEIKSIKNKVDIEIETFVHGAMCFAYSGKCLFSSFAGGRSGNRGRCAQPCRKCYELFDEAVTANDPAGNAKERSGDREVLAEEYLMSLKDLCVIEKLPLLIDAGIDSFKIEGRMKNPSYVAAAVSAYRTARDLYLEIIEQEQAAGFDNLSEQGKKRYEKGIAQSLLDLQDIYNRGGFYSGYYFTDKGKPMAALKRPNHMGLKVGTVDSVNAPKIAIKLDRDLHRGDVIEIRKKVSENDTEAYMAVVELTSGAEGSSGQTIRLNGKDLKKIKPGMEVWRTRNEELLERIDKQILLQEKMLPVSAKIKAQVGELLSITLLAESCGKDGADARVTVEGEMVEAASKAPTSSEDLMEKMKKSGGSGISIEAVEIKIADNAFIRMSAFNQLRREAADKLKETIVDAYHR